MSETQIVKEGGINWEWFTEFTVNENDKTVTINRHYRLHKYESCIKWTERQENAPFHPNYSHESIWMEDDARIAIAYFVPGRGWMNIENPSYIFAY